MRRLFGEGRESDAEISPLPAGFLLPQAEALQVDRLFRLGHAAGVVAAVIELLRDVGVGHLRRGHEVFLAHLRRLPSHRAGDGVDGQFHREADPGPRHAAIGRESGLVGRHRPGAAAVDAEVVGPGQVAARLRGLEAGGEGPDRIGADVHRDLGVQPQKPAGFGGEGGDPVVMLPRVRPSDEMLAPVLRPANRAAGLARHPGHRQLLGLEHTFVAEAAAHIRRDHPHLPLVEPEEFRQAGADQMRHLGGGIDDKLARLLVPVGQRSLALHRVHALPRGGIFPFDDDRRGLSQALDVAVEEGGEEEVVAPFLMHQCRIGRTRLQRIDHGGKRVDLHLDTFGEVFGLGARRGDADRHAFADETDLVLGKRILVGGVVARQRRFGPDRPDVGQVGGGEDPAFETCGLPHRADAPVRDGAADEGGLPLAGQPDVADELRLAGQQPAVFLAPDPLADSRGQDSPSAPVGGM